MISENIKLVENMILDIQKITFFSKKIINVKDIIEINDYKKAKFLAFENLEYEIRFEKGYSWIDLRQLEMSNVEGNKFFIENYKYFDNIINNFQTKLSQIISVNEIYDEAYDDIYSDLCDCMICRLILGKDYLFEKLYTVYKSGGWPCGWEGNFPEGKLIVFYPKE